MIGLQNIWPYQSVKLSCELVGGVFERLEGSCLDVVGGVLVWFMVFGGLLRRLKARNLCKASFI